MRKLILKATVEQTGKDTIIRIALMGEGIPSEVQDYGIYIHLRNYQNFSKSSLYDGLMFMFIFVAMERFDVFEIFGAVSKKALRNIQIFQEAWHCLLPENYKICQIVARREVGDFWLNVRRKEKAVSAFSGGLDATFLALRHTQKNNWSYPLQSCVMVHGFDVRYDNDEGFGRLVTRVAPFLQSVGLTPHLVKTNVRQYELQNWEHSFSSQLSGILHLFCRDYSYALLGSSEPYNHLVFPWGSTPATDYLLSGGAVDVVHEGAGFSRTGKAELVARDSVGRRTLKVCWEGQDQAANCGQCEKCVRTRLNFKAVGMDDPECFEQPFEMAMIDTLNVRNIAQLTELRSVIEYCARHTMQAEWVNRLEARIQQEAEKLSA